MLFNLRTGMTGRPKVPGSTPNPLSKHHETNPYNPVTKHNPNGGTFGQSNNNSHSPTHVDFNDDNRGRHDNREGVSFDARVCTFPGPVDVTGLGTQLANEYLRQNSNMSQHINSGAVQNGENQSIVEIDNDKLIRRVLHDIKTQGAPYELLQSVQAILNNASITKSNAEKLAETLNLELITLRAEVKKKTATLDQMTKTNDIYKERLKVMEGKARNLETTIKQQANNTLQNKRATTVMSNTNRLLIGSLEALQGEGIVEELAGKRKKTDKQKGRPKTADRHSSNLSDHDHDHARSLDSPSLRTPLATSESRADYDAVDNSPKKKSNPTTTAVQENLTGDKLKISLLQVSREHYKSVKKCEALEKKVYLLREEHEAALKTIYDLKLELEEYREGSEPQKLQGKEKVSLDEVNSYLAEPPSQLRKIIGLIDNIDENFMKSLRNGSLEPMSILLAFTRVFNAYASLPESNVEADIARYFVSHHLTDVFECEVLNLYVMQSMDVMMKYSTKSKEQPYEVGDGCSVQSIAREVLSTGAFVKTNSVSRLSRFHHEIDGANNVIVKNVLCVPLYDHSGTNVIAAITVINKHKPITEADVTMYHMYFRLMGPILAHSIVHKRLNRRYALSNHLLNASTALYTILPEPGSIAATRPITLAEVLHCVEFVAKTALSCSKVRCFISADAVEDVDTNDMFSLEDGIQANSSVARDSLQCQRNSKQSGIAGHVLRNNVFYIAQEGDEDMIYNEEVDVKCGEWAFVTVPITDFKGKSLACIQVVEGILSPQLNGNGDHSVLLDQAAQWLVHQIMPSLVQILLQVRTKALVKLQAKSEEQAVTDRMPDAGLSKDVNADGYEAEGNKARYGSGVGKLVRAGSRIHVSEDHIIDSDHHPSPMPQTSMGISRLPSFRANGGSNHHQEQQSNSAPTQSSILKALRNESQEEIEKMIQDSHHDKQYPQRVQDDMTDNQEYSIEAMDTKLEIAVNKHDENGEDTVVDMTPKSSIKYRLSKTSEADIRLLNEMDGIKQLHQEARLEVEKYKNSLGDKEREIAKVKEEVLVLQASKLKLSERMERDKNNFEESSASLKESNAQLLVKVNQLEDSNKALNSSQQKSQEEIDLMRKELETLRSKVAVLGSISPRQSEKSGSEDKHETEKEQTELLAAIAQIQQKDEVIKILQEQLSALANEAENSLDEMKPKTETQSTGALSSHENEWVQNYDNHGNVYFYNTRTQESSWDPPPGFN